MSCRKLNTGFLPFPRRGQLAKQMNFSLRRLRRQLAHEQGTIYTYIVATIKHEDDQFVQTGSAPNFQGDLITLCTCKHLMRTSMEVEGWQNNWVAGFTSIRIIPERKNALVYLMKVGEAFASHRDLWFSSTITEKTKRAKAADLHPFGDLYKPCKRHGNPYFHKNYFSPCPEHVHTPGGSWYRDVDYTGYSKRRPALLVGELTHSFLWNKPLIFLDEKLGRWNKKWELAEFLEALL